MRWKYNIIHKTYMYVYINAFYETYRLCSEVESNKESWILRKLVFLNSFYMFAIMFIFIISLVNWY